MPAVRSPSIRKQFPKTTNTGKKVFIRYQNRKIYDRETSKYITLPVLLNDNEIGSFIILDHKNGKDVTDRCLVAALSAMWIKNPSSFHLVRDIVLMRMVREQDDSNDRELALGAM